MAMVLVFSLNSSKQYEKLFQSIDEYVTRISHQNTCFLCLTFSVSYKDLVGLFSTVHEVLPTALARFDEREWDKGGAYRGDGAYKCKAARGSFLFFTPFEHWKSRNEQQQCLTQLCEKVSQHPKQLSGRSAPGSSTLGIQ